MDQERIDDLSRSLAAGSSRRGLLQALGIGGASGLLAVFGLEAIAGERPHQRLQDRSKRRNRKQRNKRQDNKDNQNQNNSNQNSNGGGGLGAFIGRGTSVAYAHQNADIYYIRVFGVNGNVDYVVGPSSPTFILSATEPDGNDESAVTFTINYPGFTDKLYIQAANYPFGDPSADYDNAQNVLNPDGSNSHASRAIVSSPTMSFHQLDVGDSYQLDWQDGRSFKVERQSDSDDYKMFLVTALAS